MAEFDPTRRDLLRSIAAMGMSFLVPGLSARAADIRGTTRPKSLITLWLGGGPSQLETWDPHPETVIGGGTKAIDTSVSGLQIAEFYPRVAERMDRLSVIRSLTSLEGDHARGTYYLKTGRRPDPTLKHPALGAMLAHELPDPKVEIPLHVSLVANETSARGGFLGDKYDAFKVFNPGVNLPNVKARVGDERQQRRLAGLDVVSRAFARGRASRVDGTLHQHTVEQALTMMRSEQLQAFELEAESKPTIEAYGDSSFGRGCLVARRLVEQGVRAVEVTLRSFDSHANNRETHAEHGETLDTALSALLDDLVERDLLDSTVVLVLGEFGRTPKVNALEGRDHWPHGFSCLVGGGGLASGVVIGETDPTGERKQPKDPIEVKHLFATLLRTVGVDHEKWYDTPIGRPMQITDEGHPIDRLVRERA